MPDGTQPPPTIPNDAAVSGGAGEARERALAERQVEALGELVGIGLKLARAIERRVDEADAGPQGLADLNAAAIAFARVARAVRQTIMLQCRLQDERTARAAKAGDLRARVSRIVRQAIEDGREDAERAERLAAEAAEGLEQERWGDLLTRPVGEIVAAICKDLGLRPDWPALEDDIADAEALARGKAAGAPAPEADVYAGPVEVYWLDRHGRPAPASEVLARDAEPLSDTS